MPDFFDRLLARHAPAVAGTAGGTAAGAGAGAGAEGGPVRVRPRLPGPFERIETLGDDAPAVEAVAPRSAAPPRPANARTEPVRIERETRTEHHTVVRTALAPREETARRAPEPPPAAPLLRPAASVGPAPRPVPAEPGRRARREPARDGRTEPPPRTAAAALLPPDAAAAPATRAAVPLRPRADEAAAARDAARTTAVRRRSREAERVVHVQIGRLEVSAGPSPKRAGADRPSPGRAGRQAPAMSLQDYLSRGERRN